MRRTIITIRTYSFYLFLMGSGMMIMPNFLLSIFGFAENKEIWIRVLGLFTFTTGFYYFYSSLHKQEAFFKATIYGRIFFFVVTLAFVLLFQQSLMLALIGSVDLIGAIWTYSTLRKNHSKGLLKL